MIPNNNNNIQETSLIIKENQSLIVFKKNIKKLVIISIKSILYATFLIIANIIV